MLRIVSKALNPAAAIVKFVGAEALKPDADFQEKVAIHHSKKQRERGSDARAEGHQDQKVEKLHQLSGQIALKDRVDNIMKLDNAANRVVLLKNQERRA